MALLGAIGVAGTNILFGFAPVYSHGAQKPGMIKGGRAEKIFSARLASLLSTSNHILDVGTSQRFAKELRPYESWFNGKTYLGAGYNPSLTYGAYNCDLQLDIEDIPFLANQFDSIIYLDVLEHLRHPQKSASKLLRVLKPGGILLLTKPFLLGYHGKSKHGDQTYSHAHDAYPDFFLQHLHQTGTTPYFSLNDSTFLTIFGP
jgi:SAM-dependent methyltransferase